MLTDIDVSDDYIRERCKDPEFRIEWQRSGIEIWLRGFWVPQRLAEWIAARVPLSIP